VFLASLTYCILLNLVISSSSSKQVTSLFKLLEEKLNDKKNLVFSRRHSKNREAGGGVRWQSRSFFHLIQCVRRVRITMERPFSEERKRKRI
jgi:hypothetical protein